MNPHHSKPGDTIMNKINRVSALRKSTVYEGRGWMSNRVVIVNSSSKQTPNNPVSSEWIRLVGEIFKKHLSKAKRMIGNYS